MDLQSLSTGEKIAAGSGAAFFLFLFVSWLEGMTAFQLFDIVDVLLALLALVTVALPLAKAAGAELPIRPSNKAILTRIGVVVLTVTVAFFLEGAERGVGIFLAVLAAAGILYGAVTMPGEDAPTRRRDRSRPSRSTREYEEPPPGMESWREGAPLGDEPDAGERGAGGGRGVEDEEPGLAPAEPPRTEERPRARDSRFEELEFEEPERTETRRPRRPPDVPRDSDR